MLQRYILSKRNINDTNQFVIFDCDTQIVVKATNSQIEEEALLEVRVFNTYNNTIKNNKINAAFQEEAISAMGAEDFGMEEFV